MSRIGKKPIAVPKHVSASLDGLFFSAKGPKGSLNLTHHRDVVVTLNDGSVLVEPKDKSVSSRQAWGLTRSLIKNILQGVSVGFSKKLEINGVGYRAQAQGNKVKLSLGYSHEVVYDVPEGVTVTTPKPTEIEVSGIDCQLVGQVSAEIRSWRPPEPYKGKGIKYSNEFIFRKEGKKK